MTSGDDASGRPSGRSGAARPEMGESSRAAGRNERQPALADRPGGDTADPAGTAPDAGPADAAPDAEEPVWSTSKPPLFFQPRVLLTVLVILLVVGAVALSRQRSAWPPKARCDHPAIAASVGHVRIGYPLYWAITGPDATYAVTFGASRVRLVDGAIRVTDTESMAGDQARVVQPPTRLTGCRRIAHFDMPLPSGEYHLRMYRVAGGSARQVAATRVDSDG